ncbi:MAG: hypothetical protein K8I65_11445 [Thermoanaerobaculia bacterium]|nr:hypothetical protein [Thermoanaerobaculia bacterium]
MREAGGVEAAAERAIGVRLELTREALRTPPAGTLLEVVYGGAAAAPAAGAPPRLDVPNRLLGGPPVVERWLSASPVRSFARGDLAWSEDGERLAGCRTVAAGEDLAAVTRQQFDAILDLLAERGFPRLLRVWNYLPGINERQAGGERYRLFNRGRAEAFAARGGDEAAAGFPASSAVGAPGDRLYTVFLATGAALPAPHHLENPRQVPAWRYPRRYGPVPPSFSRATLGDGLLLLSGTASVVGHATWHPGALAGQLAETQRNIERVLAEARQTPRGEGAPVGLAGFDLVKIYLRSGADLAAARAALDPWLSPATPAIFLEADICRADLLVEIEGVAAAR